MVEKSAKRTKPTPRQLPPIGWREWLSLPEFGIDRIKAKIDTGARSSAIHAFNLKTFKRDGQTWVRFHLHPRQRDTDFTQAAEALMVEERWIRSSNGQRSLRPVISTQVVLGGLAWRTEITLVRRDLMGFRMLLGRQSIRNRFLIDPGRSFLGEKIPRSS